MRARTGPLLLFLSCLAFLSGTVPAWSQTPMTTKGLKGVWHWPKNTTIKLYVPPDPDGGTDRRQAIIDGIKAWVEQEPLKSQNIKIEETTSDPGTDNAIKVSWAAAGSLGGKSGAAEAAVKNEKSEIGYGRIDIDRNVSGNDFAYNLGLHEGGHIFGVKDDRTGTCVVMDSVIKISGRNSFSKGDLDELKAAYLATQEDTNTSVDVAVTPVGSLYRYSYTTSWLSGGNLAVFQVDTHGALISDIAPPTGWRVDQFGPSWDFTPVVEVPTSEIFLGFVHAEPIYYLSADVPQLAFAFTADRPPGEAEAFLNGRFQTLGPEVVPEPATPVLLGSGVVFLGLALAWRRRKEARQGA